MTLHNGLCTAIIGIVGITSFTLVAPSMSGEEKVNELAIRSKIRYERIPKKVLAFYYPWYGTPQVSGRWIHYVGVDTSRKSIANWTHYPALGPYDSHDPKVIDQHCRWAKGCGIDGFIVSWWGRGDHSDRAMPLLLKCGAKHGLEITIYYETVPGHRTENAITDLLYILKRYGKHRAFLRLDGKPVLFIYGRALGQLRPKEWLHVLTEVNRQFELGAVFIVDTLRREAIRIADGIHTYNPVGWLRGKSPQEARQILIQRFRAPIEAAKVAKRVACVTIIPGYDDTKIRTPGLKVERFDGQLYRELWKAALELKPHWVLITSWNEWHEGSEIEPSSEYGDTYLKLTREYSEQFKASP